MNVRLIKFLELFDQSVQYSVPRWQRRYSWDKATIQQLIKDLEAISKLDKENASHFGGTLITYSETTPAGTARVYHVVDGQQRLTTISILLACIAEKLRETGRTGQWSSEDISSVFLRNQLDPSRKLNLQDEDDDEYKRIIEGHAGGKGKVTAAWQVLRSEVASVGADRLMEGLGRFKVISFTCEPDDDPQQIFESLNATGVPLTEGEKVKNWLLMGLDRKTQDRLYLDHWYRLEKSLDAVTDPVRIDEFLRDFLRWKTGEIYGIRQTYANLRRWWHKHNTEGSKDRISLCEELARLAELYGKITGTNGYHENREVDELLRYLRGLGIDVHRPFTLRLLSDDADATDISGQDLAKVLKVLSTWLTRVWLANDGTASLNTESTRFAHHRMLQNGKSYADYWADKINRLRGTRIAVPNEEKIREGIRKGRAYRGKAAKAARTILWEINSQLSNTPNPKIEDLTIEHIMPQNLSKEWREYLGEDADELHENYVHTFANLTLVGKEFNSEISNRIYVEKCKLYQDSIVMLTRKLAQSFDHWREGDMERRGQELINLILKCWPWEDTGQAQPSERTVPRWRINQGDWREEKSYRRVLLNVVAGLLDLDPLGNAQKLSGNTITRDLLPSDYPIKDPTRYKRIPGYRQYMKNVALLRINIIRQCSDLSRRCGVEVEVE